jgi:hypothetical protein
MSGTPSPSDERSRLRQVGILLGLVFVAGAAYAYLTRCAPDSELRDRIKEAAAKEVGSVVRLADFTEFEWDRVHFFWPYASPDTIEGSLGFPWECADHTENATTDFVNLLVFVKGGAVVRHVECGRYFDRQGVLTRDEAVFVVAKRDDGYPRLRLPHEGAAR